MKKFLLLAALAASSIGMNAETFDTFFKLTYEDQVIENGQTVTDNTYFDEYAEVGLPGFTKFVSIATIIATNVYDEAMDLAFVLSCVDNKTESFQLCYAYENGFGNCLTARNGSVTSPSTLPSIDIDGYLKMDIHEVDITDFTSSTTFKLDMYVTEGGEKIAGTDATVYIKFTHESDITAGVGSISAENGPEEYFNLQGIRVAQPERGNIYIVRNGSKVSKRLF